MSETSLPLSAEWLEADGEGGYASGTVAGYRTRRYHALLLPATTPPTGRVVLVNGFEAWVTLRSGDFPLSTQHYGPDVVYPRGLDFLVAFEHEPWPHWTYRYADGTTIVHEIFAVHGEGTTVSAWKRVAGNGDATLHVRPLISARDYHALTHENPAFDFAPKMQGGNVTWRPYAPHPAISACTNGGYSHEPAWYRNFLYAREAARGLDCVEDLASPGVFSFDLAQADAVCVLRAGDDVASDAAADAARMRESETRRRGALPPLGRAAEAYVVRRGAGRTIIAGYPWFTDWGRDTFIAMRGLILSRGRFDLAHSILGDWSGCVSQGMLPNRYPDGGQTPEYNAVDASLWFVIAAYEYLARANPSATAREPLVEAAHEILDGYTRGTRYRIGMDDDGLLACGVPGVQLTWMDAKVGDHVITPRVGKPVEVQALWINALRLAGSAYAARAEKAQAAFEARFPIPGDRGLYDVVDVDHRAGAVDGSVRPNQVFAIGGLPHALLTGDAARGVLDLVESQLVTPMGLRTLARTDPAYQGRYDGGVVARDGAYHQGTVWPWLMGPFVEAWLRVNGDNPARRAEARTRFIAPLEAQLATYGLGHLCEIADGEPPHTPRGCPFQAWSLGELLRMREMTET